MLIGATQGAREHNGVNRALRVKDKTIEMSHPKETLYSVRLY